jgi:hypothetical protein
VDGDTRAAERRTADGTQLAHEDVGELVTQTRHLAVVPCAVAQLRARHVQDELGVGGQRALGRQRAGRALDEVVGHHPHVRAWDRHAAHKE